ncbi:unnamed protein product [Cylindrotheca closterium]|uniref:HSF-type DNA-binding domain-containing protein n=1 Tax=Cylindrotheca closterium TaxID=2856 RepID=A0AAD2JKK4_9STRA|nr:unnamed protein product [Cylindrotheca closterium]
MKTPLTSIGAEGFDTMLYSRGVPLVSPTASERETIGRLPFLDTTSAVEEDSINLTKRVLKMAIGTTSIGTSQDHPILAPRPEAATRTSSTQANVAPGATVSKPNSPAGIPRLNKFVRRLYDMLEAEKSSGLVEWRKGLLVLYSTDVFAKKLLPKYFSTQNFKTFRRQLNYYGFVHVRSFSTSSSSSTTALWVNRSLAQEGMPNDISAVLRLKRVEPCEGAKTAEGRRHRKEMAISTVEEDIGVSARSLELEQIQTNALHDHSTDHLFHSIPHLLSLESECNSRQKQKEILDLSVPLTADEKFKDAKVADQSGTKLHDSQNDCYDPTSATAATLLLMLSRG